MTTKEQALKHLDELEEKVKDQGAALVVWRNRAQEAEKQADELKSENQRLGADSVKLMEQITELRDKLEEFSALEKALGKIKVEGGVTAQQAREIAREEAAKVVGSNPAPVEGVQVTETVPYLDLKISKPWVPLNESTVEGQIAVLALKGRLPMPFTLGNAAKQRELEYAVHGATATIQKALDSLVGKYKVLERSVQGNQYVYSLRDDARSRVKESETREAVEAQQ